MRLHGTRLPHGYTIFLRLPSTNDTGKQPRKPARKRRRKVPDSEPRQMDRNELNGSDKGETTSAIEDIEAGVASDDDEDEMIRQNNAYPGASNTIGSIHQRHWFLGLDRSNSGFRKARSGPDEDRWVRTTRQDGTLGGFEPFIVRGRDHETSVVTGRRSEDILGDEGITNFMGRKMWRPIIE